MTENRGELLMEKKWLLIVSVGFLMWGCRPGEEEEVTSESSSEIYIESKIESEISKTEVQMTKPEMQDMMSGLWEDEEGEIFYITPQGRYSSKLSITDFLNGPYDASIMITEMGLYDPISFDYEKRMMEVIVIDEVFGKESERTLIFSEDGKQLTQKWSNDYGNFDSVSKYIGEVDELDSYLEEKFPGYLSTENIPEQDLSLVEAYRTSEDLVVITVTEYHETDGIQVIGNPQIRTLVEKIDSGNFTPKEKILWIQLCDIFWNIHRNNKFNATADTWLYVEKQDGSLMPVIAIYSDDTGDIFINQTGQ